MSMLILTEIGKMSYDTEHYYALHTFLEDDELHNIWNIVEKAMNREGYDVSNSELSMRLYDSELEEIIEHDMENLLGSLSEGKDYGSKENFINEVAKGIVEDEMSGVLDDYGSKVDALVDSMGVTDKEVSTTHRRKDLDLL